MDDQVSGFKEIVRRSEIRRIHADLGEIKGEAGEASLARLGSAVATTTATRSSRDPSSAITAPMAAGSARAGPSIYRASAWGARTAASRTEDESPHASRQPDGRPGNGAGSKSGCGNAWDSSVAVRWERKGANPLVSTGWRRESRGKRRGHGRVREWLSTTSATPTDRRSITSAAAATAVTAAAAAAVAAATATTAASPPPPPP